MLFLARFSVTEKKDDRERVLERDKGRKKYIFFPTVVMTVEQENIVHRWFALHPAQLGSSLAACSFLFVHVNAQFDSLAADLWPLLW